MTESSYVNVKSFFRYGLFLGPMCEHALFERSCQATNETVIGIAVAHLYNQGLCCEWYVPSPILLFLSLGGVSGV